jgi:glycosyltransferase involved in cell wall biosynthesis
MERENLGAIINYLNYEANPLSNGTKLLLRNNPMSDEILTSVVIPVYNEGGDIENSNIIRTINYLKKQQDLSGKSFTTYELIVVNNNSTDNSEELLKAATSDSPTPILLITEERQGYEYALKSGFDFALRRFFEREIKYGSLKDGNIKFKAYSVASTDADPTDISKLWIYRIQELMTNERVSCFGGPMPLNKDDAGQFPNINLIIERYTKLTNKIWKIFGGQTPGANMGIRPYWYATIGGVKRVFDLPFAMDVYMGNKIMTLGGNVAMLPNDAFVCFNLRRVLDNPIKWFAGQTYSEGMTNIRDSYSANDLPNELIEIAWDARKRNTISILIQLILLKPSVLYSDEEKLCEFFETLFSFQEFRNKVIELSGTSILEARNILLKSYLDEITAKV